MRWLAALLLLTGVAFAQSQQAPTTKETPKAIAGPAQEERGTKDNPLTVNVVPTAEQKTEAEKQNAETKIKAAQDEKIVEYTHEQVLIGVVTFFIFLLQLAAFIAQAIYIRRSTIEMRRTTRVSIRATRAAQKAAIAASVQATTAEKALTDLERPYIFIFGINRLERDTDTGEGFVEFTVVNYGKMPAIIESPHIGFEISERGEPPIPTLMADDHTLLVAPIVGAGERRENIKEYVPDGMGGEDITVEFTYESGDKGISIHPTLVIPDGFQVFVRAVIRYRGPFSGGYETGALWLYNPVSLSFAQRGGEEYNYIK